MDEQIPKQLTELKLLVKRNQYKNAKLERTKELIKMKAERIKRQA